MANPYSSVSISGYNVDPPSNDASEVDSNQLDWVLQHKAKLGDPLKNLAESINTNSVNAHARRLGTTFETKSTNYNIAAPGDQGKFFEVTGITTITLPAVADAGDGFPVTIINNGTGTVTIDGNVSELINGSPSIVLSPGESILLTCDGLVWIGAVVPVFGSTFDSKSTNYTIVDGDKGRFFDVTGTTTITLLPVATAGDGFPLVIINNGTGTVTIDGNVSELINGSPSIVLSPGNAIILTCDGAAWVGLRTDSKETIKFKTADKSLATNITPEDDNHLFGWNLIAGKYYSMEAYLIGIEDGGNFRMAWQFSNAAQISEWTLNSTDSGNVNSDDHANDMTLELSSAPTDLLDVGIRLRGVFQANATTGGTLDFQWSQFISDAQDSTLKKGSWVNIKQMD